MADKSKIKSEIYEWVSSILWAVIIALIIKTFIFNTTLVKGESMYPTLEENDRLFAQKVSLYFKAPKRGDIVVIEAPDLSEGEPKKDYIKRVIGVEGDRIKIEEGRVYLNDQLLVEDYIAEDSYTDAYDISEWEVEEGTVFVLGDNRLRNASKDSRYFGLVDLDLVKGIANFRFYPFKGKFGRLK